MRQSEKKKEKNKIAIVLMLCFSVMALTSIFTIKSGIDKINQSVPDLPVSEETKSEDSGKVTSTTSAQDNTMQSSEVSSNIPTVDSLEPDIIPHTFVFPVNEPNAKITNPYSMDKLIYSVTLDQYMTHSGVDIEAPEDTQVLAIADGTVTSIYNDGRYGTSIEITHPNRLISIYSNLSTSEMVEIGDVVTKGQIIGGVGSTGLFESSEPSHLHFEIIKAGAYVNPCDYIIF